MTNQNVCNLWIGVGGGKENNYNTTVLRSRTENVVS